ncbi:helix-turn-helix domain-containing protein [Bulleidia sp. zg-1013]|uniref:helix-turn-helix transcriptional regulator n=1 Tax=Bacillati TaxID=1783272 RepID=UPI001C6EF741|nr:helix-turn-helix domain-containing protein [Trueperella sp. zg.1013]
MTNNRIAEFRKPLGLSQHRLAKLVGLKCHSIIAYENQTKIPDLKITYEISEILRKDIKEVFIFE